MEKSTHPHVNEGIRNTVIVLIVFGLIALISYMEWSGRVS